jgi:quercetin dioxygenase-like cupin family protein
MDSKLDIGSVKWVEGKVKGFHGKPLIDLNNGTVKLVRVDPGADYPQHRHPDRTEYAYVVEGCLEFTIGDDVYTGNVGDFYIFPSNTLHAIRNKTNNEGLMLIGAIKETTNELRSTISRT